MSVIDEIAAERHRQIEVEGWTAEHDDGHNRRELAYAAVCYIEDGGPFLLPAGSAPIGWPWARELWKPKDRRRNLIRAAALIVAEIERMDRALTEDR